MQINLCILLRLLRVQVVTYATNFNLTRMAHSLPHIVIPTYPILRLLGHPAAALRCRTSTMHETPSFNDNVQQNHAKPIINTLTVKKIYIYIRIYIYLYNKPQFNGAWFTIQKDTIDQIGNGASLGLGASASSWGWAQHDTTKSSACMTKLRRGTRTWTATEQEWLWMLWNNAKKMRKNEDHLSNLNALKAS